MNVSEHIKEMKPLFTKEQVRNSNNVKQTNGLFFEAYNPETSVTPLYTLDDFDKESGGRTYLSFKRIYVECSDPTEYVPAKVLLGSVDHWRKLVNCAWFKSYIEEMRQELDMKIRSDAVKGIVEIAADEKNSSSFQARKFLSTKGYSLDKTPSTRGRPTKEEVEREKKVQAKLDKETEEAAQRLGLSLVK